MIKAHGTRRRLRPVLPSYCTRSYSGRKSIVQCACTSMHAVMYINACSHVHQCMQSCTSMHAVMYINACSHVHQCMQSCTCTSMLRTHCLQKPTVTEVTKLDYRYMASPNIVIHACYCILPSYLSLYGL